VDSLMEAGWARAAALTRRFALRTLGDAALFEVDPSSGAARELRVGEKPLAILVYCACERPRVPSRAHLASLFWPDVPAERARRNVRQSMWRLRSVLGDVVVPEGDSCAVRLDAFVVDRDALLETAHRRDADGVLSAYGGPFLRRLEGVAGDEFDDWLLAERHRLESALVRGVGESALQMARAGRRDAALELANWLYDGGENTSERVRFALEVYLEVGDDLAARRAAEELDAIAQRDGESSGPAVLALIARARTEPARPELGVRRRVMRFTGRDAQLETVIADWRASRCGESHVISVLGAAGAGKSRMLHELATVGRREGGTVVTIQAVPGETDVPFGLVSTLARELAQLPGALGIAAESAAELVALDPALARCFPAVRASRLAGDAMRLRSFAVLDLLTAVCEQQPVMLLLDDLHWCDQDSLQLLEALLRRVDSCPLLVVAAARGIVSGPISHPRVTKLSLTPLRIDELAEAIRSTGSWPNSADARGFIERLSALANGIPQQAVDRLALALELGLISWDKGSWRSPDWTLAGRQVSAAHPLDIRLQSLGRCERSMLLTMAVAGTALSLELLMRAEGFASKAECVEVLQELESKGLVVTRLDLWRPAHEAIAERLRALSPRTECSQVHVRLARALASEAHPEHLPTAIRHFIAGDDGLEAGKVFHRLVRRARDSGDRRDAVDLLADAVGERLTSAEGRVLISSLPWFQRWPGRARRLGALAAGLALAVSVGGVLQSVRPRVIQLAPGTVTFVPAPLYGPQAFRLLPPLAVQIPTAVVGASDDRGEVRVRVDGAAGEILAGDRALLDSAGNAVFGGLRLRVNAPVITLQFEAEGHRVAKLTLPFEHSPAPRRVPRLEFVEGRFGARLVQGPSPALSVPPFVVMSGIVQLRYTSIWPAASVWLSMTPTWGDPREAGRDLMPLSTPVDGDIVDVPIDLVTPAQPGRYWIVFVLAAEPSGGYALSLTNWTLGEPRWNDDNNVAGLGDSILRQAGMYGRARVTYSYPGQWNTTGRECELRTVRENGSPVKRCVEDMALTAIELVVAASESDSAPSFGLGGVPRTSPVVGRTQP